MLVIYNPTAGRRRVSRLWRVLDVLVAHGVRLEVVETRHAGHAGLLAREAARRGPELVVAAGGDGPPSPRSPPGWTGWTRRSASSRSAPPTCWRTSCRCRPTRPAWRRCSPAAASCRLWPGIARGRSGDRLFVQMLGIGFDAHVVHRISRPVKRALGKGAYVLQTLAAELPRYDFAPVRLRIDGEAAVAGSVIIAKGSLYGGPYLLAPEARTDAPGFSVMLFEQAGIASSAAGGCCVAAQPARSRAGPGAPARQRGRAVGRGGASGAGGRGSGRHHAAARVSDARAPLRLMVSREAARRPACDIPGMR